MASLTSSMAGLSLQCGFANSSGIMGEHQRISFVSTSSSSKVNSRSGLGDINCLLRRWELKKLKDKKKMHVRLGDTVKVISGKDKGKVGEVTKLYPKWSKIIVKDANIVTKHIKPREKGESGQILKVEAPMHSSNVQLYSTTANVVSRVGHKYLEDGTKVRYLIKTGEVIDSIERWKALRFRKKDDKDEEGETKKDDDDQSK